MLKRLEDKRAKGISLFRERLSLRAFLIIPFAILMAIMIVMVTLLSFLKGQDTIDIIKTQIRERTFVEIKNRLISYMGRAHELNKAMHDYISKKRLNINDPLALQDFFWNQLSVYPNINSVYFGYKDGGIVLVARNSDGSFVARESENITPVQTGANTSLVYALNKKGNRVEILKRTAYFDVRPKPWFKDAIKKKGPIWTKVHTFFLDRSLGITAALPLYDQDNKLRGVIATDILLSTFHKVLKNLKFADHGQIFIIEKDGALVASSEDNRPFFQIDTKLYRMNAKGSTSEIIRQVYQYSKQNPTKQKFDINVNGTSHLVELFEFKNDLGIDWQIGITVSENEILGPLRGTLNLIMYFGVGALIFSIVLCYVLGQRLSAPLRNLKAVATSLAHHNTFVRAKPSGIIEINTLASTFNFMANQMQKSVSALQKKNKELGSQIEEKQKAQRRIRSLKEEIDIKQRTKLAGELHDGIGQSLQAINLGLRMLNDTQKKRTPNKNTIPDLIREVDVALVQLRTIIEQQRPMFLDQVGIIKAIESYGKKIGKRSDFRFTLKTSVHNLKLATYVKEPVFLIFQEALNNITKYANAKHVRVNIHVTQNNILKMKISDDGVGFNPNDLRSDRPGGLGLSLMAERAASVDGKLNLQSKPDTGTTIFVEVPLEVSMHV
ncbi:MAG: cache domain-containing protein [Pseudomonadota bacterium]